MYLIFAMVFLQGCLGSVVLDRRAECNDICIELYSPVCGSDGKTYSNECFFEAAQCRDPTLTITNPGECGTSLTITEDVLKPSCPDVMCFGLWEPVCGSDGVTYSNSCDFSAHNCKGDLTVAHEGACGDLAVS